MRRREMGREEEKDGQEGNRKGGDMMREIGREEARR